MTTLLLPIPGGDMSFDVVQFHFFARKSFTDMEVIAVRIGHEPLWATYVIKIRSPMSVTFGSSQPPQPPPEANIEWSCCGPGAFPEPSFFGPSLSNHSCGE